MLSCGFAAAVARLSSCHGWVMGVHQVHHGSHTPVIHDVDLTVVSPSTLYVSAGDKAIMLEQ